LCCLESPAMCCPSVMFTISHSFQGFLRYMLCATNFVHREDAPTTDVVLFHGHLRFLFLLRRHRRLPVNERHPHGTGFYSPVERRLLDRRATRLVHGHAISLRLRADAVGDRGLALRAHLHGDLRKPLCVHLHWSTRPTIPSHSSPSSPLHFGVLHGASAVSRRCHP